MTSPKYWSTFKFGLNLTHWNDKQKRLSSSLIEYANSVRNVLWHRKTLFRKNKNCDFRICLTQLCLSLHACSSSSCRDLVSRLPTRLDTKTYTVKWNIFLKGLLQILATYLFFNFAELCKVWGRLDNIYIRHFTRIPPFMFFCFCNFSIIQKL